MAYVLSLLNMLQPIAFLQIKLSEISADLALAQGCGLLYSEDLSHGQIVEGLQIVDPFR